MRILEMGVDDNISIREFFDLKFKNVEDKLEKIDKRLVSLEDCTLLARAKKANPEIDKYISIGKLVVMGSVVLGCFTIIIKLL